MAFFYTFTPALSTALPPTTTTAPSYSTNVILLSDDPTVSTITFITGQLNIVSISPPTPVGLNFQYTITLARATPIAVAGTFFQQVIIRDSMGDPITNNIRWTLIIYPNAKTLRYFDNTNNSPAPYGAQITFNNEPADFWLGYDAASCKLCVTNYNRTIIICCLTPAP